MSSVVIVSASRTAIGKFNGGLSSLPASALGATAIKAALSKAGVEANQVDEVIMGQIYTAAQGQNPARQASVAAGIDYAVPAWGLNMLCGSGLKAVASGYQSILEGSAEIVVAGGQESMSGAPHAIHMRDGHKMGNASMTDTMIHDGLWDIFYGYHMGVTAENVAKQWDISRDQQDAYAAQSQQRAEKAMAEGRFKEEITPVEVPGRKGQVTIVDQDEFPRAGVIAEDLAKLKPAFDRQAGTVTAGSASGINDGAAAVVLMTEEKAAALGLSPMARIASWAQTAIDPSIMGVGPISASKKAVQRAGWSMGDLELIEANEAFAAQTCAVAKELAWNPEIVNVNGGAIALGHPVGASGARVLTTLLHEMPRRGATKGLATLCIGGGMGIAMCVEAL